MKVTIELELPRDSEVLELVRACFENPMFVPSLRDIAKDYVGAKVFGDKREYNEDSLIEYLVREIPFLANTVKGVR